MFSPFVTIDHETKGRNMCGKERRQGEMDVRA